MYEKEMIEEMAKDTDCCDYPQRDCSKCWRLEERECSAYAYAKTYYEKGYRKIPEGSVVLDRQEHQRYCAYKIIEPQIRGCLDRELKLKKQIAELEEQRDRQAYIAEELIQEKHRWTDQARKETAEKILKDIMFCIDINDCNKNEMLILNLCKMLARQFGVEVEE